MVDIYSFHLTHVADIGNWTEIDTSKCESIGDFGRKLYTNCTFAGTQKYIERKEYDCNVLLLSCSEELLDMPIGYSNYHGLSVYCFGYYSDELSDEQKVKFCRTVYDNRRQNSGTKEEANIMIGPRADGYLDEDLDFIGEHYYDEEKLIELYEELMQADYEPQIVFDQIAVNSLFYYVEPEDWINGYEYYRLPLQ